MALTLTEAQNVLLRSRKTLRLMQRELLYARIAPQRSRDYMRYSESRVLEWIDRVWTMQQAVRRLLREEHQRADHWRAFI